MTFNEKRCKSRNQIISEPFAMRVIFMNVKEIIRKECNAIDYCQKSLWICPPCAQTRKFHFRTGN